MARDSLPDQTGSVEWRGVITGKNGEARQNVYRNTEAGLRMVMDHYRRFGWRVTIQRRQVGLWIDEAASDEERRA